MTERYVVPMYESERGWGAKIDGYSGPLNSLEDALKFRSAYNAKNNNLPYTPDWYIAALEPVKYTSQVCDYKMVVEP